MPADTEDALTLNERLEDLKRLRDELHVRRHLLGREAVDVLTKLEHRLVETERKMRTSGEEKADLARVVHDLHEALGALRDRLDGPGGQ